MPAAPSGHLRPSPGPAGTRRPSPRPGRRAAAGQHGGQDTDAGRFPALAGGDCIDDADAGARRWDGTASWAARSRRHLTLGTFLRCFRWGHVMRQLDRVSRELLARAWQASAGPGDSAPDHRPGLNHLRDLRTGQGRWHGHHGYTGKRGYHPLLATCRRRIHRRRADVPAARGAGPTPLVKVPPTSCVKRWGGCATEGPAGNHGGCRPTAASTPITGMSVAACREMDVRFSITIRQHKSCGT